MKSARQGARIVSARHRWKRLVCWLMVTAGLLVCQSRLFASDADTSAIPEWAHDALVIANPAAAVGGCQAGIYTPAANGIQPWRQAMIRWLTSRHVMGNAAVLVRQEGPEGGAGLSAIVDPDAEYQFEVSAFVSQGGMFGDRQDDLRLLAVVFDTDDRVIAQTPIELKPGAWSPARVTFQSGRRHEVRCIVRAESPSRLPCFYYAEEYRLTRKDQFWWSPQNLFDASRTAVRVKDERETLIRTMDPDIVGGHNGVYLNWDGYFTRRGIGVGGGQWEQEYNHLGTDDPLVEQFRDNGMAWELDRPAPEKKGLWPGYNMCHTAPLWHTYQRDRMVRIAPDVHVISQDNICAPSFEQYGKCCYCRWCREAFCSWLKTRWSAEHLHAAGIADPAKFDIAQYVTSVWKSRVLKGRDAVLADPVLRAFIQFHYNTQLNLWRDNVLTAKKKAGHSILVCGNQWGGGGQRPFCVALSQVSDAAVVETGGSALTPRNRVWDALATKLPMAAGEYRRPVWLYMTSLFHAPEASQSRLRLNIAQAWADGGVPNPWATAAGASGWYYDGEAAMSRFVQRHREMFSRRDRVANVGLVYSLPTHAWRQFRAFNMFPKTYQQWFVACAQLLEEAHIPYEVNCWWHPLLGDDRDSLERLNRYQVLVLPGVDCFSEAQREAVRAFQARGGRVVSVACPTTYDADAVARPAGDPLATPGQRLFEIDPDLMTRYARASEKPSAQTAGEVQATAGQLQATLEKAVAGDRILETETPRTVWANLWLDDTRHVLALHLVNGDIDVAANRFRALQNSRWRVRVPAGLSVNRAVVVNPDEQDQARQATPLAVEVADGWATVVVPRLECYTMVAMFDGEALAAAADLAQARRAIWRASMIRGQSDAARQTQLNETLSLLRAGRYDMGAPAASRLARDSQAALVELLPAGSVVGK